VQVRISDHYQNARHTLEGDEDDVRQQLLNLYPHLLVQYGSKCSVDILVNALNNSQFASAAMVNSMAKSEQILTDGQGLHITRYPVETGVGQLHTLDDKIERCRAAAAFLAGFECSPEELRAAYIQTEDPELAALQAHRLPVTMLEDLRGILNATNLTKSEAQDAKVKFQKVEPTNQSSKEFVRIIQKASDDGEIEHFKLGDGKHNKGVLKAKDTDTHRSYILKPGSGPQNPIIGESDTAATQSQREAAFYSVGCAFGLNEFLSEAHLLLLDGQEYACIQFLTNNYKNLNDLKDQDPNLPKRLLSLYSNGTLHKWAAMDFILGNPDRHSGNIMASGETVKLIDHGSAFAGEHFDPAKDGRSFVPYYLRPGVDNFHSLSAEGKLRVLPRLNSENERKLRKWISDLSSQLMGQLISGYGIDPSPEIKRLQKLQQAISYQNADLAVLCCWVVG
jgi:major membrane immunogen (membrane-anchored lipoprotein)